MATKNTNSKTGSKKAATKPAAKKGRGKAKSEPEGTPPMRVACVCIGMFLLVAALFMVAAFTSFIVSNTGNVCGGLGQLTAEFFINDCFGVASYFIPIFLVLVGLRLIGSFKPNLFLDFVKIAILMVWLSIVMASVGAHVVTADDWHVRLGGYHGERIHNLLEQSVGIVGELGIIALTVIFVLIYFGVRSVEQITEFFKFKRLQRMRDKWKEKHGTEYGEDNSSESTSESEASDDAESISASLDEENESENGSVEIGGGVPFTIDLNDPENLSEANAEDGGESEGGEDDIASMFDRVAGAKTASPAVPLKGGEGAEGVDFTIEETQETEKGSGEIERGDINTPYDPRLSLEHYKFPSLDLLEHNLDSSPNLDPVEQQANRDRITKVLSNFGVEITSIKATIGPTVTLYEIVPAPGVRISKIKNLEEDIALSLAAEGIRIIAPIPGKGTIGIEVPNKKKCIVSGESVLSSKVYQESKMELPCAMGKTITNEVYMFDLAKAPHVLVAGATGQGKSVGLNAIIVSLLYKKHPTELKLVMVDPKKVEFSVYAPIANQYLAKLEDEEEAIITENQRVIKTLNGLCELMDDRYRLLKKAQVRNIKEYNAAFKERRLNPEDGHKFMPYYVVVIDEYGDLIMTAGKEIETPICRLAQLARAVGIHLIIATQRPTAKIVTGTIKANFPARIAFKVASSIDSKVILDRTGANQLIGRGDMLILVGNEPVRVQCDFIDTPEVTRICKFISEQQKFPEMTYLPEPPETEGESGGKDVDMSRLDSMFADCARLVVSSQQGSTSKLQREYAIGYNRAGKIMDQLERAGIVGPQQGSKPREVLIQDPMTLENLLTNLGLS